jgi:ADP-dependent NAD(P)H-hydrate dehydratase / NAD(P)H-hydrate epimerase
MRIVTVEEMQALERESENKGVSTEVLMENAGLAVAQEAWLMLGTIEERRVVVLVGPGNNGGDGLVAARHLHDWGARVSCYLMRERPDDAHLDPLREQDVEICSFDEDRGETFVELARLLAESELVIDALLGTGRARAIDAGSPLAVILDQLRSARARPTAPQLVAVDLPSGVDADRGVADPHTVAADVTVALGFSKVGLHLLPGSEIAGRIQVVEIGLPAVPAAPGGVNLMTLRETRAMLPERPSNSNKGTFGKTLVIAGSRNYVGAAYLSTMAAMRAGAGLVTLACPQSTYPLLAARLAEATFHPLPESESGRLYAGSAGEALQALEGYNSAVLGCGLGQDSGTLGFVRDFLFGLDNAEFDGLVIDADGLNNLAQVPRWWQSLPAPVVLTPHPGEFARLSGSTVRVVQADRLSSARRAAEEWGQVVVLKGANTVVADRDGETWISSFANAALASAGTGDVLAGLIGGLIAQGLKPFRAAVAAVYLHGATGEMLAAEMGSAGVLAGDLLDTLPRTMKEIRG